MKRMTVERVLKASDGAAALARRLGISTQAISQWRHIPIKRVVAVEEITGIPREKLRPDIFAKPTP